MTELSFIQEQYFCAISIIAFFSILILNNELEILFIKALSTLTNSKRALKNYFSSQNS